MRVFAATLLALGLAVMPAMAGTGNTTDKDSAAGGNTSTAANTSSTVPAPAPSANAGDKPAAASSQLETELQELRALLELQTKQSQQLKDQLQQQKEQMQVMEEELNEAKDPAPASAESESTSAAGIGPSVAIANATAAAGSGGQTDKNPDQPASISIKGITLTPGGFMAAETVWRQKALASDVNTPFNSIPFNGSSNAHMSEFQASGRQSRISMLVQGQLDSVKIGGYYETDFLSAATTSTPTESNSYSLRQRQFWAQAAFNNGLTFTGGQMWSLITETTHGMDNRTEATPMTIDSQYNVGFSWARQYGARLTYDFGNKVWLGFSVEQSTPTVTVHGNPTAQAAAPTLTCTTPGTNNCSATGTYTLPINLNPTFNNFLFGAFGTSSGLYNPLGNYGYNDSPDFVLKAVFEPGFGHYEVFGVVGEVRDRVFPCVPITGTTPGLPGCSSITSGQFATNKSATTGGVGANARWNLLAKKVDLGIHFLGGAGIGRYGSGTLADLTVRPDGTPVPIHNFQSLGTLQLHPTSKLDIYFDTGGEFDERTDYIKSGSSPNEGYGYLSLNNSGCWNETLPLTGASTSTNLGVPTGVGGSTGFIPGPLGSCTGDTRRLLEGTVGFWYRFYKGSRGTFQYGMQYSNVYRDAWRGTSGTIVSTGLPNNGEPHADENMVFTSFRYYLP